MPDPNSKKRKPPATARYEGSSGDHFTYGRGQGGARADPSSAAPQVQDFPGVEERRESAP